MNEKTAANVWRGRFTGETDSVLAASSRSSGMDRRSFAVDVRASGAHCDALAAANVLSRAEAQQIHAGLQEILERGQREPDYFEQSAEDVHSFLEARLIEIVGDLGRKLHTGRSRNDQVATDLRLWLREEIDKIVSALTRTQEALLDIAEAHPDVVIPAYTHLQRAQPVLFAHWCLAYFEMLARDRERLSEARKRVNVMPLGAAALAGTSYLIDREAVANELGFESVARNSLDAVSDRDFCVEFTS